MDQQTRLTQLMSLYSPDEQPRAPLDFGDYLSLVWRLDQCDPASTRETYYRACVVALGAGLGIDAHPLGRLVTLTSVGSLYAQIPNLPYRSGAQAVDVPDRRAALAQLMTIRADILRLGTYHQSWGGAFPGSGILEDDLRERVFAVLITAYQGQFTNFARLLLVTDIVIGNLLLGLGSPAREIVLPQLIREYDYPDPSDARVRRAFTAPA